MQIKNLSKKEIQNIFDSINNHLNKKAIKFVKYLNLGNKTIRIISYDENYLPLIEKQLSYILKNNSEKFDDTLIIWSRENILDFAKEISSKNEKISTRIKFEKIFRKAHKTIIPDEKELYELQIIDDNFSKVKPLIDFQVFRNFFIGNNKENHTYYYCANDLSPEEIIKEGHIFVQFFNNILKTETSNLIHGAVIGYKNRGICFCARGQRGKSTLSVLSLLKGFEYVSDDYLILHKDINNKLLSSPIYSIITLSAEMYNRLYNLLDSSRFVSNNARKDKYVFNISNLHDKFKTNYPIELCIFPEITSKTKPEIRLCTEEEKGRALVQLIQSTLVQTQDLSEHFTIKKIMNMVKNLPFYKFDLSHNIDENTEFLRNFMKNFETREKIIAKTPKIATDITFNIANILNTELGIVYTLGKFTTNIYENLLKGVSKNIIKKELEIYSAVNPNIIEEFEIFTKELEKQEILNIENNSNKNIKINQEFAKDDNYRFTFIKYSNDENTELIKIGEKNEKLCIK